MQYATATAGRADLMPAGHKTVRSQNFKCGLAAAVLLTVTWLPLLGMHVYKLALSNQVKGTVVAVFSPALSHQELIQKVVDSRGAVVRPVLESANVWLVHSSAPEFVGRLKQHGAWGVFSPDLLRPETLFSCFSTLNSA